VRFGHAPMSVDAPKLADPREPAIATSPEKLRVDERAKQRLAFPLAQVPETLRLRTRQLQARHVEILSANLIEELRMRRERNGTGGLFGRGRSFARLLCHQPRGNDCRVRFRHLRLRRWRKSRW